MCWPNMLRLAGGVCHAHGALLRLPPRGLSALPVVARKRVSPRGQRRPRLLKLKPAENAPGRPDALQRPPEARRGAEAAPGAPGGRKPPPGPEKGLQAPLRASLPRPFPFGSCLRRLPPFLHRTPAFPPGPPFPIRELSPAAAPRAPASFMKTVRRQALRIRAAQRVASGVAGEGAPATERDTRGAARPPARADSRARRARSVI